MREDRELQTQEWLARAVAGDQEGWRLLVESFAPRVFGLLKSHCRDSDLAEELTQSVFATIAEKLSKYAESGRFEAWLFRIAMNRLRDEMRRRVRHARSTDTEVMATYAGAEPVDAGSYRTMDPLQRDALEQAMAELTPQDREIVDLRHTADLSFKQIAALLDEPVGTLLARHHRALAKLREAIERRLTGET